MRVLTYNLWGVRGDWPSRRTVIAAELRRLEPDVAVFQETVVQEEYDQVVDLLGHGYEIVHQIGRTADGVGASIASRWPMTNLRQRLLHVTTRVDAAEPWIGSVALVDVQVPEPYGRTLLVHFKPSWQFHLTYERELQARIVAQLVEDAVALEAPAHVVLAGDLDSGPESSMIRFWSGRQSLDGLSVAYRDAWEDVHGIENGQTFTAENPLRASGQIRFEIGRRIDYVFVRADQWGPTLGVTGCAVVLDQPVGGVWASDHFGVLADLEPPG
ncbi:endonuclease/exonuclease/phosphatase family protein [Plantactinospora sp. WMMB782]|uniref:endonuclease/exonuclease/phosphatase family protein n=1 Tax=Plantactinospora sp. WMMB782 TaxID=3404121 RepID=UPI003B93D81A